MLLFKGSAGLVGGDHLIERGGEVVWGSGLSSRHISQLVVGSYTLKPNLIDIFGIKSQTRPFGNDLYGSVMHL